MELLLRRHGFEVQRTSAGHVVIVDPQDSVADRATLVSLLAEADALDALFFPSVEEAVETIDGYIANRLTRRGR